MTKLSVFILALLVTFISVEPTAAQDEKVIAFYNLENLFDIYDDPAIDDQRYLPNSDLGWTIDKYVVKLDHLARVISSVDEDGYPAIVGVCEVENRKVLDDLVDRPTLKKAKYQVIHFNSPDERGIDNALLYAKKEFIPVSSRALPVILQNTEDPNTRDILYVKGVFKEAKRDTLHLFVNHWPSRWGGQEKTDHLRQQAAAILKTAVDSILAISGQAHIILMGDFNDEPENESLKNVLQAKRLDKPYDPSSLYNLMYPMLDEGKGTLWYRDWDVFDQMIVTGSMLTDNGSISVKDNIGHAFGPEWLMFKDNDGNLRPNRTAAREYYGGFSDHLLVYIRLIVSK